MVCCYECNYLTIDSRLAHRISKRLAKEILHVEAYNSRDHRVRSETSKESVDRHGNITRPSTDRGRQTADQLAPTLRRASLDCNGHAVDCQCVVGSIDLVHTVRFAAGIGQRTGNLITQAGDRSSADVVVGRTANNRAAMIGLVANRYDFQGHLAPVEWVTLMDRWAVRLIAAVRLTHMRCQAALFENALFKRHIFRPG